MIDNLTPAKNEILGDLDELNSFLGLAKSFTVCDDQAQLLTKIQNSLFLIQAEIADVAGKVITPSKIRREDILFIESKTVEMERELSELDHFIVPEGHQLACVLHVARTIARRVERKLWPHKYHHRDLICYLDRIACLLFDMARLVNQQNGFQEKPPAYYGRYLSERREAR
ncbi:MAG: cob(I)yrinic acid a,c-diamide adenosyltransferase [bacterium]|nr:cob(I)yrinic acid a,c-diamide adenosyltransferase [bacterium]